MQLISEYGSSLIMCNTASMYRGHNIKLICPMETYVTYMEYTFNSFLYEDLSDS